MKFVPRFATAMLLIAIGGTVCAQSPPLPAATSQNGVSPEVVSQIAARLITEAIPREYERKKDWGRTKQITTGVRSSGNFFDFNIHSRKTEVNHGVWKHYRVTLIEPEKNLVVWIDNLRSVGPGRIALTLYATARLHGWARAKVYENGIHIIALEAEGDTTVQLWLDAEIALESVPSQSFVPGIAVRPEVKGARLKLDDFRLNRISDVSGPLVRELGDGLRHVIEDELAGPKLVAKIIRSIDKRRDKLVFTADKLLGVTTPQQPANHPADGGRIGGA